MEEKNVSSGEGLKCPVTATTESISPSIDQRESKVECPEDEDKKKGEVRDDSETPGTSQTKKTDWAEEEFWKPIEYFADDCNLPNEGLMPNDVPKTLVSDEKLLSEAEKKLREKQQLREDLETASLMKKKCDIELQLNDGVFDDKNPEDAHEIEILENEEEEVTADYASCLSRLQSTAKEEETCRSKREELRSQAEEVKQQIKSAEGEIHTKQRTLASIDSTVKAFIPTATELNKTIFRLSSCPVCTLGFHCHNFMATPRGHAYHPACLLPILAKKENLECLQCKQSFHPH
ncbi:hypothetical protein R1sor_003371 [Riccia sorocarpa]|uniref:Uncharacterized protein n=1 Tax=Riccia sorocarpa TaxID=122646 RepID=A0ABD3H483_9MARC